MLAATRYLHLAPSRLDSSGSSVCGAGAQVTLQSLLPRSGFQLSHLLLLHHLHLDIDVETCSLGYSYRGAGDSF